MSIDEIIEEHARMKRQLFSIRGWLDVCEVDCKDTAFAVEQIRRAVAVAFAKNDGYLYADQNQRYELSDFEKYRALVFAIDVLDAAGMFESPAAEALRDASDAPWYAMTEGERETLRMLPRGQQCQQSE